MYLSTLSNPSAASLIKSENAPVHLNDRYRPRDIGVGYGKSSGYASTRKYVSANSGNLVRVR